MKSNASSLLALVLIVAAFAATGVARQVAVPIGSAWSPPNIVFILADDLGWGDLGCYGNTGIRTPNIDALRADGLAFGQYVTGACVCSPARGVIMTARFAPELGIHRAFKTPAKNAEVNQSDYLDPDLTTVADVLKAAGYATGHFGKWHLGNGKGMGSGAAILNLTEYGFDEGVCSLCAQTNPGRYDVADPAWAWSSSEWIVDDAIDFIQRRAGGPFYVQVWLGDPHATVDPTPQQVEAAGYAPSMGTPEVVNGWTSAKLAYYAAVTNMDAQIGRLLAELDALGLRGNTIVVFTSDNGPATIHASSTDHSGVGSAGPYRGGKQSIYPGGVMTPCIVRWPGVVTPGTSSYHPVSGLDWLPTFAAITGQPPPPGIDGESIMIPLVMPDQPWSRQQTIKVEWRFGNEGQDQRWAGDTSPGGGLFSTCGRWVYYANREGAPAGPREELYYLPDDPMTMNNVIGLYPSIAQAFRDELRAWQATLPDCAGCESEGDNSYPWP